MHARASLCAVRWGYIVWPRGSRVWGPCPRPHHLWPSFVFGAPVARSRQVALLLRCPATALPCCRIAPLPCLSCRVVQGLVPLYHSIEAAIEFWTMFESLPCTMNDSKDTCDEPEERLLSAKRGGRKSSWVDPLYASQPKILWDRKTVVTCEWFAEKYKLHNNGITSKHIKISQHLEEADVESLFGLQQNGNGYRYSQCTEEFVRRVETMWMICHHITVLPNTCMVNVSEAKNFAYEIMKKRETKWALNAEWTCRDQLKKIRAEEEESRQGKLGHVKTEKESGREGQPRKENCGPDLPRDPTFGGGSLLA